MKDISLTKTYRILILKFSHDTYHFEKWHRALSLCTINFSIKEYAKIPNFFERYTESYPESWARKIIWAYQKMKESGEDFYWTDIRKSSGVKKKNFQSVVPYLAKHTEAETVRQIIEIVTLCNPH